MVLSHSAVQRVATELAAKEARCRPIALADSARTAQDAASALSVAVGAIIKSLVFMIDDQAVVALIAGDKRCAMNHLPNMLGIAGIVRRADAQEVRRATGFAIGGVSPVGYPAPLPVGIDPSLERFSKIFAAAGHPHSIFETDFVELQRLTGGRVLPGISIDPDVASI